VATLRAGLSDPEKFAQSAAAKGIVTPAVLETQTRGKSHYPWTENGDTLLSRVTHFDESI
jgi:hypothetical protein